MSEQALIAALVTALAKSSEQVGEYRCRWESERDSAEWAHKRVRELEAKAAKVPSRKAGA